MCAVYQSAIFYNRLPAFVFSCAVHLDNDNFLQAVSSYNGSWGHNLFCIYRVVYGIGDKSIASPNNTYCLYQKYCIGKKS